MPAPNQPLFRSNAIKHYMQSREKHELPRFVSLPLTILLWVLLTLLLVAGALVWGEQVPMYATTQGIVIVQSATQPTTQPSRKPVSTIEKQVPAMGKLASATKQAVPVANKPLKAMAIFFISPAQVPSLHIGMPIRLHVSLSGLQFSSQITSIEPGAMSPVALRSLYHLESVSLPITQPSAVITVNLDPAFATAYAGSALTADVQVGSQSLISFLPGVGNLFGK